MGNMQVHESISGAQVTYVQVRLTSKGGWQSNKYGTKLLAVVI